MDPEVLIYNKKLGELKEYLPFLDDMESRMKSLQGAHIGVQLAKIQGLKNLITSDKRMKMENLLKCEQVLIKLHKKTSEKLAHVDMFSNNETPSGNPQICEILDDDNSIDHKDTPGNTHQDKQPEDVIDIDKPKLSLNFYKENTEIGNSDGESSLKGLTEIVKVDQECTKIEDNVAKQSTDLVVVIDDDCDEKKSNNETMVDKPIIKFNIKNASLIKAQTSISTKSATVTSDISNTVSTDVPKAVSSDISKTITTEISKTFSTDISKSFSTNIFNTVSTNISKSASTNVSKVASTDVFEAVTTSDSKTVSTSYSKTVSTKTKSKEITSSGKQIPTLNTRVNQVVKNNQVQPQINMTDVDMRTPFSDVDMRFSSVFISKPLDSPRIDVCDNLKQSFLNSPMSPLLPPGETQPTDLLLPYANSNINKLEIPVLSELQAINSNIPMFTADSDLRVIKTSYTDPLEIKHISEFNIPSLEDVRDNLSGFNPYSNSNNNFSNVDQKIRSTVTKQNDQQDKSSIIPSLEDVCNNLSGFNPYSNSNNNFSNVDQKIRSTVTKQNDQQDKSISDYFEATEKFIAQSLNNLKPADVQKKMIENRLSAMGKSPIDKKKYTRVLVSPDRNSTSNRRPYDYKLIGSRRRSPSPRRRSPPNSRRRSRSRGKKYGDSSAHRKSDSWRDRQKQSPRIRRSRDRIDSKRSSRRSKSADRFYKKKEEPKKAKEIVLLEKKIEEIIELNVLKRQREKLVQELQEESYLNPESPESDTAARDKGDREDGELGESDEELEMLYSDLGEVSTTDKDSKLSDKHTNKKIICKKSTSIDIKKDENISKSVVDDSNDNISEKLKNKASTFKKTSSNDAKKHLTTPGIESIDNSMNGAAVSDGDSPKEKIALNLNKLKSKSVVDDDDDSISEQLKNKSSIFKNTVSNDKQHQLPGIESINNSKDETAASDGDSRKEKIALSLNKLNKYLKDNPIKGDLTADKNVSNIAQDSVENIPVKPLTESLLKKMTDIITSEIVPIESNKLKTYEESIEKTVEVNTLPEPKNVDEIKTKSDSEDAFKDDILKALACDTGTNIESDLLVEKKDSAKETTTKNNLDNSSSSCLKSRRISLETYKEKHSVKCDDTVLQNRRNFHEIVKSVFSTKELEKFNPFIQATMESSSTTVNQLQLTQSITINQISRPQTPLVNHPIKSNIPFIHNDSPSDVTNSNLKKSTFGDQESSAAKARALFSQAAQMTPPPWATPINRDFDLQKKNHVYTGVFSNTNSIQSPEPDDRTISNTQNNFPRDNLSCSTVATTNRGNTNMLSPRGGFETPDRQFSSNDSTRNNMNQRGGSNVPALLDLPMISPRETSVSRTSQNENNSGFYGKGNDSFAYRGGDKLWNDSNNDPNTRNTDRNSFDNRWQGGPRESTPRWFNNDNKRPYGDNYGSSTPVHEPNFRSRDMPGNRTPLIDSYSNNWGLKSDSWNRSNDPRLNYDRDSVGGQTPMRDDRNSWKPNNRNAQYDNYTSAYNNPSNREWDRSAGGCTPRPDFDNRNSWIGNNRNRGDDRSIGGCTPRTDFDTDNTWTSNNMNRGEDRSFGGSTPRPDFDNRNSWMGNNSSIGGCAPRTDFDTDNTWTSNNMNRGEDRSFGGSTPRPDFDNRNSWMGNNRIRGDDRSIGGCTPRADFDTDNTWTSNNMNRGEDRSFGGCTPRPDFENNSSWMSSNMGRGDDRSVGGRTPRRDFESEISWNSSNIGRAGDKNYGINTPSRDYDNSWSDYNRMSEVESNNRFQRDKSMDRQNYHANNDMYPIDRSQRGRSMSRNPTFECSNTFERSRSVGRTLLNSDKNYGREFMEDGNKEIRNDSWNVDKFERSRSVGKFVTTTTNARARSVGPRTFSTDMDSMFPAYTGNATLRLQSTGNTNMQSKSDYQRSRSLARESSIGRSLKGFETRDRDDLFDKARTSKISEPNMTKPMQKAMELIEKSRKSSIRDPRLLRNVDSLDRDDASTGSQSTSGSNRSSKDNSNRKKFHSNNEQCNKNLDKYRKEEKRARSKERDSHTSFSKIKDLSHRDRKHESHRDKHRTKHESKEHSTKSKNKHESHQKINKKEDDLDYKRSVIRSEHINQREKISHFKIPKIKKTEINKDVTNSELTEKEVVKIPTKETNIEKKNNYSIRVSESHNMRIETNEEGNLGKPIENKSANIPETAIDKTVKKNKSKLVPNAEKHDKVTKNTKRKKKSKVKQSTTAVTDSNTLEPYDACEFDDEDSEVFQYKSLKSSKPRSNRLRSSSIDDHDSSDIDRVVENKNDFDRAFDSLLNDVNDKKDDGEEKNNIRQTRSRRKSVVLEERAFVKSPHHQFNTEDIENSCANKDIEVQQQTLDVVSDDKTLKNSGPKEKLVENACQESNIITDSAVESEPLTDKQSESESSVSDSPLKDRLRRRVKQIPKPAETPKETPKTRRSKQIKGSITQLEEKNKNTKIDVDSTTQHGLTATNTDTFNEMQNSSELGSSLETPLATVEKKRERKDSCQSNIVDSSNIDDIQKSDNLQGISNEIPVEKKKDSNLELNSLVEILKNKNKMLEILAMLNTEEVSGKIKKRLEKLAEIQSDDEDDNDNGEILKSKSTDAQKASVSTIKEQSIQETVLDKLSDADVENIVETNLTLTSEKDQDCKQAKSIPTVKCIDDVKNNSSLNVVKKSDLITTNERIGEIEKMTIDNFENIPKSLENTEPTCIDTPNNENESNLSECVIEPAKTNVDSANVINVDAESEKIDAGDGIGKKDTNTESTKIDADTEPAKTVTESVKIDLDTKIDANSESVGVGKKYSNTKSTKIDADTEPATTDTESVKRDLDTKTDANIESIKTSANNETMKLDIESSKVHADIETEKTHDVTKMNSDPESESKNMDSISNENMESDSIIEGSIDISQAPVTDAVANNDIDFEETDKSKEDSSLTQSKGKKKSFKGSRELQMLHEYNFDMFISADVLKATGVRSCTIAHLDNSGGSEASSTKTIETKVSKPIERNTRNKKSAISKKKNNDKNKNVFDKLPRIIIKKANVDSISPNKDTVEPYQYINQKPCPKSKKKIIDFLQMPTTDNSLAVVDKTPEIKAKSAKKVKKKKNGWQSGIIKKKKKYPIKNKPKLRKEGNYCDKNYHFYENAREFKCKICYYSGTNIVTHYKLRHPHSEIFISRLSPEQANLACEGIDKVNKTKSSKIKMYRCRFCMKLYKVKNLRIIFDHIAYNHTGEYKKECAVCSTKNDKKCISVCNKSSTLPPADDFVDAVTGFMCGICNYTQLSHENLKTHIWLRHFNEECELKEVSLTLHNARRRMLKSGYEVAKMEGVKKFKKKTRGNQEKILEPTTTTTRLRADTVAKSLKTMKGKPSLRPKSNIPSPDKKKGTNKEANSIVSATVSQPEPTVEPMETDKRANDSNSTNVPDNVFYASDINIKQEINEEHLLVDSPPTLHEPVNIKMEIQEDSLTVDDDQSVVKIGAIQVRHVGGRSEYSCLINNCKFSSNFLVLFMNHIESHNSVWNGYCDACKRTVCPGSGIRYNKGLEHLLSVHSNNSVMQENNTPVKVKQEFVEEPEKEPTEEIVNDISKTIIPIENIKINSEHLDDLAADFEPVQNESVDDSETNVVTPVKEVKFQTTPRINVRSLRDLLNTERKSLEEVHNEPEPEPAPEEVPFCQLRIENVVSLNPNAASPVQPIVNNNNQNSQQTNVSPPSNKVYISKINAKAGTTCNKKSLPYKVPSVNLLKCNKCPYSAEDGDLFVEHLTTHRERVYECVYCIYTTTLPENLVDHIVDQHGPSKYCCLLCDYRAAVPLLVATHALAFHKVKLLSMGVIPLHKSASEESLIKGLISKRNCIKPFVCFYRPDENSERCKKMFFSGETFDSHLNSHGANVRLECHICSNRLYTIKTLLIHMKNFHSFRMLTCPYCKTTFDTKAEALGHLLLSHSGRRPLLYLRLNTERGNISGDKVVLMNLDKGEFYNNVIYMNGAIKEKGKARPWDLTEYELDKILASENLINDSKNKMVKTMVAVTDPTSSNNDDNLNSSSELNNDGTSQINPSSKDTNTNDDNNDNDEADDVILIESDDESTAPTKSIEKQKPEDSLSLASDSVTEDEILERNIMSHHRVSTQLDKPFIAYPITELTNLLKDSGLTSQQLYRCGNASCKYSTSTSNEFKDHLIICEHAKQFDMLTCYHCSKEFRNVVRLLDHLKSHGTHRYQCNECYYCSHTALAVNGHMRNIHKINNTITIPVRPLKNDSDTDFFIVKSTVDKSNVPPKRRPGPKSKVQCPSPPPAIPSPTPSPSPPAPTAPAPAPTAPAPASIPTSIPSPKPIPAVTPIPALTPIQPLNSGTKTVFGPDEIDQLPFNPILTKEIYCKICNFATKVRSNLLRHLQMHANEVAVPSVATINPVPCLESNEKHFDKMANLALSSNLNKDYQEKKRKEKEKEQKKNDKFVYPKYVPEKNRFVCGSVGCKYISVDEMMLRFHWETLHNEEKVFHCVHCGEDVTEGSHNVTTGTVANHLRLHEDTLYACTMCHMKNPLLRAVEKHAATAHANASVICIRKIKSSQKEPAKETQTQPSVTQTKNWECNLCPIKTETKDLIELHAKIIHNMRFQFKCSLCPYNRSLESYLQDHLKIHGNASASIISVFQACKKSSTAKVNPGPKRKKRMSSLSDRSSTSDVTELPPPAKVARSQSSQLQSLPDYNSTKVTCEYVCPFCEKAVTSNVEVMKKHLFAEINHRDTSVISMSNEDISKWIEGLLKAQKAKIESYSSKDPLSLDSGPSTSSGTNNEELDMIIDEQRSNTATNITSDPYPSSGKCPYCEYSSPSGLRMHIKRHWKVKPLGCYYCDNSFVRKIELNSHIKAKHPGMAYAFIHNKIPENMAILPLCRTRPTDETGLGESSQIPTLVKTPFHNKTHMCLMCEQPLMEDEIKEHKTTCNGGEQYPIVKKNSMAMKCQVCSQLTLDMCGLHHHFKTEHPGIELNYVFHLVGKPKTKKITLKPQLVNANTYKCFYCKETFDTFSSFLTHKDKVHYTFLMKFVPLKLSVLKECEEIETVIISDVNCCIKGCQFKTTNLISMLEHIRTHYVGYHCTYCRDVFSIYHQYVDHARIHDGMEVREEKYFSSNEILQDRLKKIFNFYKARHSLLEKYDVNKYIVKDELDPIVVKQVARKSTTYLGHFAKDTILLDDDSDNEYSYYGTKPGYVDLKKIKITVEFSGTRKTINVEQLKAIENLFPNVLLRDFKRQT